MVLLVAGALVACGKPNEPQAAVPSAVKAKPAAEGAATAEQVARRARADVACLPPNT
jgi:hypothetical protein